MKYLPVITLGVLCAAGPALHSCNDKESGSHLKCDQVLAQRHPITRQLSSRRVRRAFDEPVGSQASPFEPPESSAQSHARPPKPATSQRVSRSGRTGGGRGSSSGPFTPPGEEHASKKKTHRGGWEPHDDDHHHHHGHHHGHVVEEEVIEEEDEEPHVEEYKPPLLNPAHDGHIKLKSHRPPPDPHWSEKNEDHPWDDKHHDDHGWKEEAQYKINDVKLRIPPVKFRFHLSPNVKIISGTKDPLQRPPPPEPEEHFPWEKPKDLPHLPWWPEEQWPEKKKNCTEESNKDSEECKEENEKSNLSKSASLTSKSSNKKNVERRKGPGKPKAASSSSSKSRSNQSTKKNSKKKPTSTTSSPRRSSASKKKKDLVTKRSGEPEAAASSSHQIRLRPRRTRKRKGWASEAYHSIPASPWAPPRPTWGDDVVEEHVEYEDDDDHDSKNAHRGSDAEGDAHNNGTAEDPHINWQDSPIHFAAHKRRWPPDTPRYSPTFKLKVHPRIWTEAPPTTTTTTTEATTTTEEESDEFAESTTEDNDEETTTEEPTTEETTTEETTTESTTAADETTTTESTTATTDPSETTTRFREPTTPDGDESTPMAPTTTEEMTTTPATTTVEASTTPETTTVETTTTEEATTTEAPSTTLAVTAMDEPTTTTLPTTTEEATTQLSNSDAPFRKKGSRIPKVFGENDIKSKNVKEKATTPLPPSTTISGTTTSWLFGLTKTTTELNPNLEREDPQITDRTGKTANGLPHPRRRLVPLSPVKIDVSSPEELAGVAVNAKVLHLFLGGPNSTSLHDSVVTVAKAVNQYNNYYKRR
ncbi:mucin-5AC-like [Galendromus occidentalis]|uniref:Mucin-5AC-like n=1 Tax=Galendromus occidentalis TaxID=34638 RepID=A0AAJ7SHV7_9ACAR|nr:mucin-5AC-like [Galendromus occidentalis]